MDKDTEKIIRHNLLDSLDLYKEVMGEYETPSDIPSQIVLDYCVQKIRVKHNATGLSPSQQLEALDVYEQWHVDNKVKLPEPDWLNEKRNFWMKK